MATNIMTPEFAAEVLKAHNEYRALHNAPELKISQKLNEVAQEWSEKIAGKEKSEHRPNNPYGENIYMAGSTDPKWKLQGETVVKGWYDEIKDYKFGEPSPKNPGQVGHFTQLVWKGTTDVGIGQAKSKSGKVYVVCNYDPPGNVVPEFAKNVHPSNRPAQFRPFFRRNLRKSGQSTDEKSKHDKSATDVTLLLEEIDLKFLQPNLEIVESMERLYAVPSEKIRVWSVWLTKVEEKAKEWNAWLRLHINLVLRMSEHLRRAEEELKKEEPMRTMRTHDEQQYRKDGDKKVEEPSMAADAGLRFEKLSEKNRTSSNQATNWAQQADARSTNETITLDDDVVEDGSIFQDTFSDFKEASEGSVKPLEKDTKHEDTEDKDDEKKEEKISEMEKERTSDEEIERSKKIAWPIGIPWEPVAPMVIEASEVPKKKEEKVKVIPIPENEEEMSRLIKDVKEQATIFRSLYKHWLEVGDKAVKEVMNRTVMETERVPTDRDIPYFFYVNTEPDIEIGVEHDDEKVLLPDLTREKITSNFTPLYFNLQDKPGKD